MAAMLQSKDTGTFHQQEMNGRINQLYWFFKGGDDIAPSNWIRLELWNVPTLWCNGERVAPYWP